ncbi:Sulfhydryl oxidase 1 (rQSOX) (rSOx) (FAD-dependent sulfhydryl oxidase-2) (SOx-2) (Quiescin Q6) [Durusdinium trenchii]|uniref:Sulfhydryl oxidase n=1 Tax=Durusdinium trenchii TaxID=1381693 RepID=A0ABP0MYC8_9DINO
MHRLCHSLLSFGWVLAGSEELCGSRWWRRAHDGLRLQEPWSAPCPWEAGGSVWGNVRVPAESVERKSWGGDEDIIITIELERSGHRFYDLDPLAETTFAQLFATNGARCAAPRRAALGAAACSRFGAGADLSGVSDMIGNKFCEHPEAKDARALFCRYPPRFYAHAGICRQYAQFCPFEELKSETNPSHIDLAVVNVDAEMFYALEECGAFKSEFWIFKVFVHWCPHCQQLMPLLYRLALRLRQAKVAFLRFGAVNCATEHALCSEQGWLGHPLLVAKYLGPDQAVHGAIEHWIDVVKDAQLRQMLPRYALPGEFPVLKLLLEHLPTNLVPTVAWADLFEAPPGPSGACPNVTALHPEHPTSMEDFVGNGWHDVERNFTVRRRMTDALIMLRHIFQEWIAPVGDDGNVEAFSYRQLIDIEAWVALLIRNLPEAFAIQSFLRELHRALMIRVRAAQTKEGSSLCANEWKSLTSNLLASINDVGQKHFAFPSACASDTCRMWSLLHILASEGLRKERMGLESRPAQPHAMLSALRGFIDHFFKCHYCRRHFLRQYEEGSYGRQLAEESYEELVLYLWRFHTAVSTRVSALHSCVDSDRRWPPSSLCPSCWQPSDQSALWEVLSEAKAKTKEGQPTLRALEMSAMPNEAEILKFLESSFSEQMELQT